MEKFNWAKAIGFGVLIWAIMFAFVSFLIGYSWYDSMISKIIIVVLAAVLSYLFAMNVKPATVGDAFGYGLSWVAVGVVLDLLITTQFNSSVFGTWEYWLGYALILFTPMIYSGLKESKSASVSHAHS